MSPLHVVGLGAAAIAFACSSSADHPRGGSGAGSGAMGSSAFDAHNAAGEVSVVGGGASLGCTDGGTELQEFGLPACEPTVTNPDAGIVRMCEGDLPEALEVDTISTCARMPSTGTFVPVVEWYMPQFDALPTNQVQAQPIVTTLNDDNGDGVVDDKDVPDIVVVAFGGGGSFGHVHAISGDGSRVLFSVTDLEIQIASSIAAGDIDGDGLVELVVVSRDGVYALENDGSFKWWNEQLDGHINGNADAPAISDMNHDGTPEIIVGRAIVSATGSLLGAGEHGMASKVEGFGTASFAVDLDGDGSEEVITGNAAYRIDGSTLWYNGLEDGYPAVGDFDGDGDGEVVVSGSGVLRLLETDGMLLWEAPIPGASDERYRGGGAPTVADFDGDGEPEIGVASTSAYAVFEGDGSLRWQRPIIDSSSSITGSSVFDFEGDGVAEVVYADETTLWVFGGVDGSVRMQAEEHANGTYLEYPTIADVDADGHAEIVVGCSEWGGQSDTGIRVFGSADDSWAPGRRTWNQHAYSITNINDDGSIPVTAAQNWLTFNNFRSGDVVPRQGADLSDPFVHSGSVCGGCAEDPAQLIVQVGNRGARGAPAGSVRVEVTDATTGGALLATATVVDAIPPGHVLRGLVIDVPVDLRRVEAVYIRVASDEEDCDTSDNELRVPGPFCATPVR